MPHYHVIQECQHGFVKAQCRCIPPKGETKTRITVGCADTPTCKGDPWRPDSDPEFTVEDLRLIKAMCTSANPQYPQQPMYPAWRTVYNTASALLGE